MEQASKRPKQTSSLSQSQDQVRVVLRTLNGAEEASFETDSHTTILQLQREFQSLKGISPVKQRWIVQDSQQVLNRMKTLSDLQLGNNVSITLLIVDLPDVLTASSDGIG